MSSSLTSLSGIHVVLLFALIDLVSKLLEILIFEGAGEEVSQMIHSKLKSYCWFMKNYPCLATSNSFYPLIVINFTSYYYKIRGSGTEIFKFLIFALSYSYLISSLH